jgi:hypothetical protein
VVERRRHVEADVAQYLCHRGVLGEDLGDELTYSAVSRDAGQVLQQQRADAIVVSVVCDEQPDLGMLRIDSLERGYSDDLAADGRHQCVVRVTARADQAGDILVSGRAAQAEEAQVDGAV